jgi:hypothetical protein
MLFTEESSADLPQTPPRSPAPMPTQEIVFWTFGGALNYTIASFSALFELLLRAPSRAD